MRNVVLLTLAAAALLACGHKKAKPPVDTAIEVHGRIIPEGAPVGGAPRASALDAWWAAMPMSGTCAFLDCLRRGWRTETPEGEAVTQCEFGDCARDGWVTHQPDGAASRTRCTFGKCLKEGWTTVHDDGTTVQVRCNLGGCLEDGWTAAYSDGRTALVKCAPRGCVEEGWTLSVDGQAEPLRCRCEFSDCRKNGAACR